MKTSIKILIAATLVIVGAGGAAYWKYQEQKRMNSAAYALEQAKLALVNKNEVLFSEYVNTHKVSLSILANMLSEEEPVIEESEGLLESVGRQLSSKLGKRIASFVQPELSKSLQKQMLNYARTGAFGEEVDLSERLYGSEPMMQSLWQELNGENQVVFSSFEKVREQGLHATAILPFKRPDLEYEGALNVTLQKEGNWQVTALPNLAEVLSSIKEIQLSKILKKNEEVQALMDQSIQVVNIEKSAGVSQWGVGKGLMLRAAFENVSEKNITAFHAAIEFLNEQHEIIKSVGISDSDFLEVGNVSEKSWPMGINPLSSADTFIYDATAASLTIHVKMETITFEDGTKLELLPVD